MPRLLTLGFLLASLTAASAQQAIDLTKTYGDEIGCKNRDGQQVAADEMLLLQPERLVTAAAACTFAQKVTAPDGTVIVMALCDLEGETGRSISHFSISPSATDAAKLVIFDEYGASLGEVAACQP